MSSEYCHIVIGLEKQIVSALWLARIVKVAVQYVLVLGRIGGLEPDRYDQPLSDAPMESRDLSLAILSEHVEGVRAHMCVFGLLLFLKQKSQTAESILSTLASSIRHKLFPISVKLLEVVCRNVSGKR